MVATTSTGIMLRLARVRHQSCDDTRPAELASSARSPACWVTVGRLRKGGGT